jgi:hypothetical protein
MRIWRDILSFETWQFLVKSLPAIPNNLGTHEMARELVIRRAYLENLNYIGRLLRKYHGFRKSDVKQLPARIYALKEISKWAAITLQSHYISDEVASRRTLIKRGSNSIPATRARDESLERNILTLVRRSLRKAAYLQGLQDFYSTEGIRSRGGFFDLLNNYVQQSNIESVSLVRTVMLEKYDPGHRGWELETDWKTGTSIQQAMRNQLEKANVYFDNSKEFPQEVTITNYFIKWCNSEIKTPFFMWLEEQPISTSEDKQGMQGAVGYVRGDQRSVPQGKLDKLRLVKVSDSGVLLAKRLDIDNDPSKVCDTTDYDGKAGPGKAAYVWSTDGDFFIGEHIAFKFHHSTFVSGNAVRCAGMVEIKKGKVTYINTWSGHYQPTNQQLAVFVNYLRRHNVVAEGCKIVRHKEGEIIV